jgi:hypothetical protein
MFVKGALDILPARCARERVGEEVQPLTTERRAAILAAIERLAAEALRTLGAAYRTLQPDLVSGTLGEEVEQALLFLNVALMGHWCRWAADAFGSRPYKKPGSVHNHDDLAFHVPSMVRYIIVCFQLPVP